MGISKSEVIVFEEEEEGKEDGILSPLSLF